MNEEEMNAKAKMALEVIKNMEQFGFKPASVFLKANDISDLMLKIMYKNIRDNEKTDATYSLFCEIEKILKNFEKELEE